MQTRDIPASTFAVVQQFRILGGKDTPSLSAGDAATTAAIV
jgi:hypothetical protein